MNHDTPTIDRPIGVRPLSAAFLSPGWPADAVPNGVIPCVDMTSQALRSLGHRVTVLSETVIGEVDGSTVRQLRASNHFFSKTLDRLTFRFSPERSWHRRTVRAIVEECRRLIDETGLEILEMEEAFGLARWVRRKLPIPVVVRLHGPWFLNGPLRGAVNDEAFRKRVEAEKATILEADAITAPSLDVLERTRSYYGIKLEDARVISNPVAMVPIDRRWRPEDAEPETILFIGRFDRHKGGDLVIDAFAEVARRRPEARLIFIGPDAGFRDDDDRPWTIQEYLGDRLAGPGLADRATWLGSRPSAQLHDFRRKAAVVVVGSRYDNFPGTVLEAMVLGCPLVAPRTGGIPEIVDDGVNGLLYQAGDRVDLAAKLFQLLEDRSLAVNLGAQAGIDTEDRRHPLVLAREIARFFAQVIENRGRSPKGIPRWA
jgi:glycosyltransferase involved in cell wall biosynthesis